MVVVVEFKGGIRCYIETDKIAYIDEQEGKDDIAIVFTGGEVIYLDRSGIKSFFVEKETIREVLIQKLDEWIRR